MAPAAASDDVPALRVRRRRRSGHGKIDLRVDEKEEDVGTAAESTFVVAVVAGPDDVGDSSADAGGGEPEPMRAPAPAPLDDEMRLRPRPAGPLSGGEGDSPLEAEDAKNEPVPTPVGDVTDARGESRRAMLVAAAFVEGAAAVEVPAAWRSSDSTDAPRAIIPK